MTTKKQKIIKLSDVNSSQDVLSQICSKLKLKGWQFDKLTIEGKILKWSSHNIDKELIIEIYEEVILSNIKENQTRKVLASRVEMPKDYDMGNPLNRWIYNDSIVRTPNQVAQDDERIKFQSEQEYNRISRILDSIIEICNIEIIKI